jgi:mono/diheme cytochrome c family protein/ABC-type amino acid transport substrate-binding protein
MRKGSKPFFFEKKNQKTFVDYSVGFERCLLQVTKSFCSFFQKEVLASFLLVLVCAAARAETLSVCIDKSSPQAGRDRLVAEAVAHQENAALSVHEFDGSGADDDDGLNAKEYKAAIGHECQIIMGFPIDATQGEAPAGLKATAPYDQTGFVLVVPTPGLSGGLANFPAGTEVAVTYGTAPNLYFVTHHNVEPDIHLSDKETLRTVAEGKAKAAMVWQPTLTEYLASTPDAKLAYQPVNEPHLRWNIVALYGSDAEHAGVRFGIALAALKASGALGHLVAPQKKADLGYAALIQPAAYVTPGGSAGLPALFTAAQAKDGMQKYSDNCAQCHGDRLEGVSGPALTGKLFASDKANLSVGDILTFIAVNMPATQPGSLPPDDYVQVMAYILQQNGYPAGTTALEFEPGKASKVPLRYHGQ